MLKVLNRIFQNFKTFIFVFQSFYRFFDSVFYLKIKSSRASFTSFSLFHSLFAHFLFIQFKFRQTIQSRHESPEEFRKFLDEKVMERERKLFKERNKRKWSITTMVEENIKCDVTIKVKDLSGFGFRFHSVNVLVQFSALSVFTLFSICPGTHFCRVCDLRFSFFFRLNF